MITQRDIIVKDFVRHKKRNIHLIRTSKRYHKKPAVKKSKYIFPDIGELGWSLYLAAHLRWLRKNTSQKSVVMTSPERKCLYEGLTDSIINLPADIHRVFKADQACFGLYKIYDKSLKRYFNVRIPSDCKIPTYFKFKCNHIFNLTRVIYEPYKYKTKLKGKKEILIFPRCRKGVFVRRNLSKTFYIDLMDTLCDEFQNLKIRSVGTIQAAYNIDIGKPNYINWIGKTKTVQDLIDRHQIALAAVGSQSAPPKLALLQGVPTFMIGHEKKRHLITDNWINTKAGFYPVPESDYGKVEASDCISKIIKFIRECL